MILALNELLAVADAVDGALNIRQKPVPVPVNSIPLIAQPTDDSVVKPVAVALNTVCDPKSCGILNPPTLL